jgi:short-subunit dehydrogenase
MNGTQLLKNPEIMIKKISLISGGASGLGLEIADLPIKSGKNVVIIGRN